MLRNRLSRFKETFSSFRLKAKKNPAQTGSMPLDSPSQQSREQTIVHLRIRKSLLYVLLTPTLEETNPPPIEPLPNTTGHLYVIQAALPDLQPFAGNTVDWLIKIARLIFQPLGTSPLYTPTTQTVEYWMDRDMEQSWATVQPGDVLRSTIYEFCPDNAELVMLSKICLRQTRSVTTKMSRDHASTFHCCLIARDRQCVITGDPVGPPVIASHIIPRRLGDSGVNEVIHRFIGPHHPNITRYDPSIGILLFTGLDVSVDIFEMGFWNTGQQDRYFVHRFGQGPPRHIWGGVLMPNDPNPPIHGHQISLISHQPTIPLPLQGVFEWHYLQCVLKRFATTEYQETHNINFFTLPFRTRDDDDDDDSIDFNDPENLINPPYPSYPWDYRMWRIGMHLEEKERNRAILSWASDVPSGSHEIS